MNKQQHTDRKPDRKFMGLLDEPHLNLTAMIISIVSLEPLKNLGHPHDISLLGLHDDLCASKDGGICNCPAAVLDRQFP